MRIWGIRIILWAIISFASGSFASLFLWGLDQIANYRQAYFIFALPLVGLLLHWSKQFAFSQGSSNDLIKNLHGKPTSISFGHVPFTLLSSWLSHFAGASVGREGVAVFMGGSIAQSSTLRFNISEEEKLNKWLQHQITNYKKKAKG